MNRFLMIFIFALCAALAQAGFVTQDLESRLLTIENRLESLEKNPLFIPNGRSFNMPIYNPGDIKFQGVGQ